MISPVQYLDYDKITDDVYFLGNNTILRFVVNLSKKGEDGSRYHFHKEFKYDSKYQGVSKAISIKRSFDFYLAIDRIDAREYNTMIRPQDMILLRSTLQNIASWYNDGQTFAIRKDKIIIKTKRQPVIITGLVGNKQLMFEPVVLKWEESECMGTRMTMTDSSIYVDMSIEKFYGFLYIINSFNMYESAQNILNYLQRPEFGTNIVEFEKPIYANQEQMEGIAKCKTRQIPKPNQTGDSYFDKMNKLTD